MELDAIAACVIGGTSLKGGRGSVLGVLFGATLALTDHLGGVVFLSPLWCGAFMGFAVMLGFLGSLFSVRQVLGRVGI